MHANCKNLSGMRFGRLLVKSRGVDHLTPCGAKFVTWNCVCGCGKAKTVLAGNLQKGLTVSCGCYQKERQTRHGNTNHPLFKIWKGMIERCYSSTSRSFSDYGARGIAVCERWKKFDAFCADMGDRPSRLHTLDRRENDGNYEPSNCRWATREQQSNNKRDSVFVSIGALTLTLQQWARKLGVARQSIASRAKRKGETYAQAVAHYAR